MLKQSCASVLISIMLFTGFARAQTGPATNPTPLTNAEKKAVRAAALEFTNRVIEARDISPVLNDLYFSDFLDRYKRSKAEDITKRTTNVWFAPGMVYDSRLLTDADNESWRQFYLATYNFLVVGFVSMLSRYSGNEDDLEDLKPADMFPDSVIRLLAANPNLANFLQLQGAVKPVSTLTEMHAVTDTLNAALAIMRDPQKYPPEKIADNTNLQKLMKSDALDQVYLNEVTAEDFGFPPGTRTYLVMTATGLSLMLARDGDRLKVFWTGVDSD